MAALHGLSELMLLPVLAVAYVGRTVWTAVLALLAGLGVMQARNSSAGEPSKYVTCYAKPREIVYFENQEWQVSHLMQNWAKAERAIIAYAYSKRDDFGEMNELIATARNAWHAAVVDVQSGHLSREAYDMAGEILAEWHKEMALAYTAVECYEAAIIKPTVEDVSRRLFTLQELYNESKLTPATVTQAEQNIKSTLGSDLSPSASAELSQLLVELLGFGTVN